MAELVEIIADVHMCQLCAKSIDGGIKSQSEDYSDTSYG